MELSEEDSEKDREVYNKILVQHYGDINSWETDHLMHFNAMFDAVMWVYECDLSNNAQIIDSRIKEIDDLIYEKKTQLVSLGLEADKLFALANKVLQKEGLEPDEKFCIAKKLRGDGLNLTGELPKMMQEHQNLLQEYRNVVEGGVDNIRTFISKKRVGRPRSNIIYHWMQHLELELGSKQKAADYVSDSIMADSSIIIGSKKPDTLKREYRRYCKAKGEG